MMIKEFHRFLCNTYQILLNQGKNIYYIILILLFFFLSDPAKPNRLLTQYTPIEERFHNTVWPQYSPTTREAYLEISKINKLIQIF